MATEDNNSLRARIDAVGMMTGNQVLDATTKAPVTASRQNWIDSDSRFASGTQQPFALGASQSTVTSPLFTLSGKSAGGILTQTLVAGSDVTTATKAHFIRIDLTDDNGVATGSFYLEAFTIT
jgi:hypothetical protein